MLGFFHQAGRVLESALELDDILDGILDLTFQIIPAERGFVLLVPIPARCGCGPTRSEPALSTTILEHATRRGEAILTSQAAYLEKPVSPGELLETIGSQPAYRCLRRRQASNSRDSRAA